MAKVSLSDAWLVTRQLTTDTGQCRNDSSFIQVTWSVTWVNSWSGHRRPLCATNEVTEGNGANHNSPPPTNLLTCRRRAAATALIYSIRLYTS